MTSAGMMVFLPAACVFSFALQTYQQVNGNAVAK